MSKNNLKMSVDYIEDKIFLLLGKAPKNSKILDIATGKGYLVKELSSKGFKNIYAADINLKNFAFDKDIYSLKEVDANKTLPYKSTFFDVVISSETIEHLRNPRDFMGEVYRILKPGGVFILTTPNVETIFSRIFFLFTGILAGHTKSNYKISGHIAVLPDFLIKRFSKEVGFVKVNKTYNCGYIPVVRLKLKNHLLNDLFGWISIYKFKKPHEK